MNAAFLSQGIFGSTYGQWPIVSLLVGLLVLNGLPQPYHPVFNVAAFARATRDRFFLCIEVHDARFDPAGTRQFLHDLDAREVADVYE